MSQRAATITSLPVAFEIVKAMQRDGLEQGVWPLGREAIAIEVMRAYARRPDAPATALLRGVCRALQETISAGRRLST